MDVLRPQLIWIGNRCYRKNPLKESLGSGYNPEDEEPGDQDFVTDQTYCDDLCDADEEIEETNKGLRLKIELPNVYYKYIVGKRGETRARIQMDTHTQIIIPKPGDKQEIIVIDGHDRKGLISAKTRIDVLVHSARQHQNITHFLSIPINSDEIVMNFEDFKFQVLNACDGDAGLDASLFQNPKKLHLTIGTLVLLSEKEIQKAISLLQACQTELIEPILRGQQLEVQVKGLEYMNDDPGAVNVLYAQIEAGDACDRLQLLVDRIMDKFSSADFFQKEYNHVKLHITLMNTLMRKDPSEIFARKLQQNSRKPRETFDASRVLKKFKDFSFGSQHISSIHLSQRYSTGPDEYYDCVSKIPLAK